MPKPGFTISFVRKAPKAGEKSSVYLAHFAAPRRTSKGQAFFKVGVMTQQSLSVKAIFDLALEISSPSERKAYLDQACAEAPDLRHKVEALLKAYKEAGSFLESPALSPVATVDKPVSEGPGSIIGPYQLLEQIGEGGMGLVFVAEQQQPVRRQVALKVIKPGMDTRE